MSEFTFEPELQAEGTPTTLDRGTVLGAKYEIGRVLGVGGMGAVYEAVQRPFERRVAVKVLHQDAARERVLQQRFEREAKIIARLVHPHIVTVHDFGVAENGLLYLVMERLPGTTLREVTRAGPLRARVATQIVRQIALAIGEAHARGVVHRDLKPSNVQLTRGGEDPWAKVLDFGIAKLLDATEDGIGPLTGRGTVGTPAYMAPEQALARDIDPRTDLYSLGVVWYELLLGRTPFLGPEYPALLYAHVHEPPPGFAEVRPDLALDARLEGLVLRALEKTPAARFQSAEELVVAIDAWLSTSSERAFAAPLFEATTAALAGGPNTRTSPAGPGRASQPAATASGEPQGAGGPPPGASAAASPAATARVESATAVLEAGHAVSEARGAYEDGDAGSSRRPRPRGPAVLIGLGLAALAAVGTAIVIAERHERARGAERVTVPLPMHARAATPGEGGAPTSTAGEGGAPTSTAREGRALTSTAAEGRAGPDGRPPRAAARDETGRAAREPAPAGAHQGAARDGAAASAATAARTQERVGGVRAVEIVSGALGEGVVRRALGAAAPVERCLTATQQGAAAQRSLRLTVVISGGAPELSEPSGMPSAVSVRPRDAAAQAFVACLGRAWIERIEAAAGRAGAVVVVEVGPR